MTVRRFGVRGLPPKKTGWSIWTQKDEARRVKNLRLAALRRFPTPVPAGTAITLRLRIYAKETGADGGDLANFIGGICDALQPADPNALRGKIDPALWSNVPAGAQPKEAIAYDDDRWVVSVNAERRPLRSRGTRYVVEVSWP